MKSMLIKHIFIKIKANYKRFLSLLSMALLGVGFYSGIQACSPDMLKTLDNFYDNNNVYDIEITSNLGMTEENLKDISKINNVEKAIGIYTKDVYLNTNNEKYVLKLIALNNEINKVYLEEGKLPNNNNEIAVEKSLLNDNNLKINDNINIENKNYKIVGTIISPLYFSTEKSNTTLGSGKIDYYAYLIEDEIKNEVYSNIYINVSNAKKELTNSDKYKSLVKEVTNSIEKIKAEKEKDRYNELYGDIIKNSKKYGISIDQTKFIKPKWYIQNRLNNESYKELINASDNIKKLGNIFPLIFFAISILVSLISMMRMIEEDRTENGTLKSLGYNNFEITLKYIIYSLLATIIGSISGVFIGSYLIPYVIWNIYKKLFFIPKFIYLINSSFNALGLLICTLCICGTAIFVCIHNLKEKPANLMRPKNPKSGKKIFIEKINFIWKKIKFSEKITIRNIFRYKQRLLMTIIGIAGCTALIYSGLGLQSSINEISDKQFKDIRKLSLEVYLQKELEEEKVNEIKDFIKEQEYIKDLTPIMQKTFTVGANENKKDVFYIVADANEIHKYIGLQTRNSQEEIELNDDGVILTEKLANILEIKVGEKIKIIVADGIESTVKVIGITENYLYNYVYMTPKMYERVYGNNIQYNAFFANVNKELSDDEEVKLANKLKENENISAIIIEKNLNKEFQTSLTSLMSIVILFVGCASLLSFTVLINLNNINIEERTRELSTIKLLGFYKKELESYVFRENIILTILGTVLGLGLGIGILGHIIQSAEVETIFLSKDISIINLGIASLMTLLFTLITNWIMKKKLKNINMIDSLKSVE